MDYLREKHIGKQVGGILSESARRSRSERFDDISEHRGDRIARWGDVYVESFFERPILNSPYAYPDRHSELDDDGQPTNQILPKRRESKLLTPVPKHRNAVATPTSPDLCSTAGTASRPKNRNTTRPRSSTRFGDLWRIGAICPTRING
jgi:hypothetical protein